MQESQGADKKDHFLQNKSIYLLFCKSNLFLWCDKFYKNHHSRIWSAEFQYLMNQ